MFPPYFYDAVGDSANTASVVTTFPKWLFGRDMKGSGPPDRGYSTAFVWKYWVNS